MYLPLFSVNLAPHLVLSLAVPGGCALLVFVDNVIQGVLELIEARKHGHGGIGVDNRGEMEKRAIGDGYLFKFRRAGSQSIASTSSQVGGFPWRGID